MTDTESAVLEKEWKDVLNRMKKAVASRWFLPKSRSHEFLEWSVDVEGQYRAARDQPYYFERKTATLGLFLVSQIFSSMPRKAAYKYLRSLYSDQTVQPKEVTDTIDETYGWLALFGHGLIESGKNSLPVDCVMDASRFKRSSSADERRSILERVMKRMMCSQWAEHHPLLAKADRSERGDNDGDHATYEYDPWMVLPHVIGRFPDSPMRPNCMGMSILMAAWCRLAEIPYMHCRLLEHQTTYHWYHYAAALERTLAYCDANAISIDSQTRVWMERDFKTAQSTMLDTETGPLSEGHAFVCAEIMPGTWMALDPWMETWFEMGESWTGQAGAAQFSLGPHEAYRILHEQGVIRPGLTLIGTNHEWVEAHDRASAELDSRLRLAARKQRVADGVSRQEHSFEDLLSRLTLLAVFSEVPEGYLDAAMTRLMTRRVDDRMSTLKQRVMAMADQLISELSVSYRNVHGLSVDAGEAMLRQAERDYLHDEALAQRVRTDVVMSGLIPGLNFYADRLEGRPTGELGTDAFISIEYGGSTTQVGLGALIHLLAWDEEVKKLLRPTDLLRLTNSQLVWQEVVTSLHHRYELSRWEDAEFGVRFVDEEGPTDRDPDRPMFGELVLTDRQDWESLLGSSGADWLSPTELALVRETTRSILLLEPFQQHRQVRRLLSRLQQENEWAQQVNMSPSNQEVTHGA